MRIDEARPNKAALGIHHLGGLYKRSSRQFALGTEIDNSILGDADHSLREWRQKCVASCAELSLDRQDFRRISDHQVEHRHRRDKVAADA